MSRTTFFLACLLLIVRPAVATTEFLQGLGDTRYHHLESAIVDRGFHLYVMLPEGYDAEPERDYPTVYVLDGGALYPMLVAYYAYLNFAGEVPRSIIVGISYGSNDFEGGNYRGTDYTAPAAERDYWGGAGKFQRFLEAELLPFVQQNYRSDDKARVIFGQSIGGQFVLFSALTRPDLFWGHIASNPALHRNLSFFLEDHATSTTTNRPKLFVSSGELDDPEFRVPAIEWMTFWSSRKTIPWDLQTVTLDGHSHMSAPPAAFRQGMMWLFDTYPRKTPWGSATPP